MDAPVMPAAWLFQGNDYMGAIAPIVMPAAWPGMVCLAATSGPDGSIWGMTKVPAQSGNSEVHFLLSTLHPPL